MPEPMATPSIARSSPLSPSSRLSHPERSAEPGAASSSSSIAAKCERLATGRPVACTAASSPASHIGTSGAKEGCRPKKPSLATSRSLGTAMRGRAA